MNAVQMKSEAFQRALVLVLPRHLSVRRARIKKSYFETFFRTFLRSVVVVSLVREFQQPVVVVSHPFRVAS